VVFLEIKISKKGENEVEIELGGEDHSFPNLLREALIQDKTVEFASYSLGHPQLGTPKLYVRTKGSKPEKALKDALKSTRKDISAVSTAFSKKTKASKKK
jgi:DNA-directed RNA polymerase subunit L